MCAEAFTSRRCSLDSDSTPCIPPVPGARKLCQLTAASLLHASQVLLQLDPHDIPATDALSMLRTVRNDISAEWLANRALASRTLRCRRVLSDHQLLNWGLRPRSRSDNIPSFASTSMHYSLQWHPGRLGRTSSVVHYVKHIHFCYVQHLALARCLQVGQYSTQLCTQCTCGLEGAHVIPSLGTMPT